MFHIIHQFSTGIDVESTEDGQWLSLGFTGRWKNETHTVPTNIELAVKKDNFKGRSGLNPAIIGRVVTGGKNEFWSVVAVVTKGRDKTRTFSVYRYFWCQGQDNLCLIVGWLLEQNQIPTFNPFESSNPVYLQEENVKKYREEANHLDKWISTEPTFQSFFRESLPRFFKHNQYNNNTQLPVIDRLANKIANNNKCLTSWAFQVENLNQPEEFLIIQTASFEAYNKLQSVAVSPAPIVVVEPTLETNLKSVIQDLKDSKLTNKVFLKLEYVLSQLNNIPNSKELLDKIFEDLGAIDALEEQMYQSGRVELVTMRAILIPETLVQDYVYYAHIESNIDSHKFSSLIPWNKKKHTIKPESLNFQSKLRDTLKNNINSYPQLRQKLEEGIFIAIEELVFGKLSKEAVSWLLTSKESFLGIFPQEEFLQILSNEVSEIYELNKQIKAGNPPVNQQRLVRKLWADLENGYYGKLQYQNHYKPLADILLELGNYELAYYFYKVSNTKNLNNKIIKYLKAKNIKNVFGIVLPPIPEPKTIEIINILLYILFFLLVCLRSSDKIFQFVFGLVSIIFLFLYIVDVSIRNKIKQHSLPIIMLVLFLSSIITASMGNTSESVSKTATTFTESGKTHDAIQRIQENLLADNQFQKNYSVTEKKIIEALKEILEIQEIQYSQLANNRRQYQQQLEQLVVAISKYQQNKQLPADGIIDLVDVNNSHNSTMAFLQEDIKQKIIKSNNSNNTPKPPINQPSRPATIFDKAGKTREAIRQIQNNLLADNQFKKTYSVTEKKIIEALKEILQIPEIQYSQLANNPKQYQQELEELVSAIYKYQQNKQLSTDGIIDLVNVKNYPKSTMAALQEDIKQKISKSAQ
ncbi:MAG: hypothetical protein KME52_22150 [Desmonostoc geniculatum HA4340-LM1]|jgi:pantothenate kinase type III|nr:hypothetical protein [Desmonostoc geniculatum HA4340-LM1]